MPKCIHLICRRDDDGISLNGLSRIGYPNVYRSLAWEIPPVAAEALVGGWAYLHPAKSRPSEFGGKIIRVEDAGSFTAHGSPEVALIIGSSVTGKNQKWRGAKHGMAWSSGLVDADLPHELGASDA